MKSIFDKRGSDKSKKHSYHLIYEECFRDIKDEPLNILEIGIFRGNSIESWIEYFPNATIHCIDIFERIQPDEISILTHPRVKWIRGDSTAKSISSEILSRWNGQKFDIIIDDGLHTPQANRKTFLNLMPFLSPMGSYFVEDVFPLDIMSEKELNSTWIKTHEKELNKKEFGKFTDAIAEYKVTVHDNRSISKQPDSVIYQIQKVCNK